MKTLKEHLESVPPGVVHEANGLDRLLADCWDALEGASEDGMAGFKLVGRMESVEWQSPILSFAIERHGATVCGSTRAELQHWEMDLDRMTATITKTARRQLEPMADRISVKATSQEIAQAILDGRSDTRLRWDEDGSVQVLANDIYPKGSGYKATVEGRRKRLCKYVDETLAEHGWEKIRWNRFRRHRRQEMNYVEG